MRKTLGITLAAAFALGTVVTSIPAAALAAGTLDTGALISETSTTPYDFAQKVGNGFDEQTIFGMHTGAVNGNVDIYSFTTTKEGEQTIKLAIPESEKGDIENYSVVLLDPTTENEAAYIGIPVPSDEYQTVALSIEAPKDQNEPLLLEKLVVVAEGRVKLLAEKTYYIVVLGPPVASERSVSRYVLRIGEGSLWSAGEFVRQPFTWLQYKLGLYGGSTQYSYPPTVFGAHLGLLGLVTWVGFMIVQLVLTFMAAKRRAAGYLLVKLQPISRIAFPVAAWFTLLGGYLAFSSLGGMFGVPFAIMLTILPALVVLLVEAFATAPKLARVDLSAREAVIPKRILAALYVHGVIGTVSLVAVLALVAQWFTR